MTAATIERSEVRRVGDSWFFPVETDVSEAEHRVDLLAGRLYCTCLGFLNRRTCRHIDWVREKEMVEEVTTRQVIHVQDSAAMPDVWRSPVDLARRLEDMRQEAGLVQQFFKDIMVASRPGQADGDYGIIPGTEKPTLFKAGAEKLCELYGYAPIVADLQEYADYESGHYRVVVRMALVHKGSGVKVAEGIGECNTRESRYAYRWVYDNEVPAGIDLKSLKVKEFKRRDGKGTFKRYRLDNEDLFSLWNTILKMAKKRALVDATLSATRSSGIFTQSAEHLDEWIDADFTVVNEGPAEQGDSEAKAGSGAQDVQMTPSELLTAIGKAHGNTTAASARGITKHLYDTTDLSKLTKDQREDFVKRLHVWLTDKDHEHAPQFLEDGKTGVCEHCGLLAEAPVTEAVASHEHVEGFDEERSIKVCGICGIPLEGPDAPTDSGNTPLQPGLGA